MAVETRLKRQALLGVTIGVLLMMFAKLIPLLWIDIMRTSSGAETRLRDTLTVGKIVAFPLLGGIVIASLSLLYWGVRDENEAPVIRGSAILGAALLIGLGILAGPLSFIK
jgi:hypothetical protein